MYIPGFNQGDPPPPELDDLAGLPRLLTIDQAARVLQRSKSTLYSYVSTGHIRHSVIRGGRLRFDRDQLIDEFWRAQQRAFRDRSGRS